MRLWTISFKYLDAKGLVALWREALLAKNVLAGLTKGYNAYLAEVYEEACARGYKFDAAKVGEFDERNLAKISVSRGQIEYEFAFLQEKLKSRDAKAYERNLSVKNIEIASIFKELDGEIEPWEKVKI